MDPLSTLVKAVTFPFKWVFVVGTCYLINALTSPGDWWAHWVALGMTIALVAVWLRALKMIVATVGLAGGIYLLHRWWSGRRRPAPSTGTLPTIDR